jgi:hypothetical protein
MSNAVNVEGTVEYVEADFADAHAALPQSKRARVLVLLVPLLVSNTLSRAATVWSKLVPLALFGGL